ncbi:MAG: hypothetical protein IJJ69_01380 [Oscillospiraceae bacterium]|nr:hypothetical protein [Oscillospiraceae bacterium]
MNPQKTEVFIQKEKYAVTVLRPVLAPEEQQIRRKELEFAMKILYQQQKKQEHDV